MRVLQKLYDEMMSDHVQPEQKGELAARMLALFTPKVAELFGIPLTISKAIEAEKQQAHQVIEDMWHEFPYRLDIDGDLLFIRFEDEHYAENPYDVEKHYLKAWYEKWHGER